LQSWKEKHTFVPLYRQIHQSSLKQSSCSRGPWSFVFGLQLSSESCISKCSNCKAVKRNIHSHSIPPRDMPVKFREVRKKNSLVSSCLENFEKYAMVCSDLLYYLYHSISIYTILTPVATSESRSVLFAIRQVATWQNSPNVEIQVSLMASSTSDIRPSVQSILKYIEYDWIILKHINLHMDRDKHVHKQMHFPPLWKYWIGQNMPELLTISRHIARAAAFVARSTASRAPATGGHVCHLREGGVGEVRQSSSKRGTQRWTNGISWNLMECHGMSIMSQYVPIKIIMIYHDNQADSMDFNRLQIFQLPGLGKFIR
jgi:hypothetical protein